MRKTGKIVTLLIAVFMIGNLMLSGVFAGTGSESIPNVNESQGDPSAGYVTGTDRAVETRPITVTINWAGDLPEDFTYPEAVYVTMERSVDGETWEPYEEGGPFEVTPDASNNWTASFAVPAAGEEEAQPYYYRITEDPAGLSRFLRSGAVTVAPEASGAVSFTNTYNDNWDYTVDLYWDRSGDERYHVNTETVMADGDSLIYKLDIRTQKTYEAIPTNVTDEALLNSTTGLVIRIPLHLFKDRNNNWVDPSGYAIADDNAPTTDREFTYRIIGDEIVFYNYRTLPSSYTASYTVGYTVIPAETLDGSTGQLQATAVGHYSGQPSDDPGLQVTTPITYRIDTGSYITTFLKEDGVSLYHASGSLNGMPMDNDNYNYLYYIVRMKPMGNQPATVTITDTPKYFDKDTGTVVDGGEIVKVVKWTWTKDAPTAPAGEYPTGTNVTFTAGDNGSASWTATYDAVTACTPAEYGSTLYQQVQKAKAEQDFFVVVRYLKSTYNPVSGPAPNYQNVVTAELEVNDPQNEGDVRPDPANGIEGNDFNDTYSKSANASAEYIPNSGWGWNGGTYSVEKTNPSEGYGNGSGTSWIWGSTIATNYNIIMNGEGYNLTDINRGYSMTMWDDDVYARPVYTKPDGTTAYGAWTKLGPGDYDIVQGYNIAPPGPRVQITAWQVDRDTGVHVMDTSKLPSGYFRLYGKKADGSWELITSFTMTADNSEISSTSEGDQAVRRLTLKESYFTGKGYIGLKVESPQGLIDHVQIKIHGLRIRLLGNSPKMTAWRQQYGDSLKNAGVINFATYRFYEDDGTGNYVWSNPQSGPTANYSGSTTGLAESEKTTDGKYELYESVYTALKRSDWESAAYKSVLDEVNDTTERMYRYKWRISGMQYLYFQGSPSASMREFMADTGVFYDLLPVGYSIDLTKPVTVMGYSGNQDGGTNSLYATLEGDPIVIENYKNTGRQLVIFKVKTLKAHGYNYYIGAGQLLSGFCVDFWTQVEYSDISGQTVTNIFSYQRGDRRPLLDYTNSQGYGSTKTGFYVSGKYPLANVEKEVFGNTSTGNTTEYSYKQVLPNFLPSIQAGLYKAVRASSGVWISNDVTDVDDNYAYRLRVQTAGDNNIKYFTGDIIIYDTLENAANTSGNTGETDGWKGTLVSVDTSAITRLGIGANPVVYYTTKVGISYNDSVNQSWNDSLANNPEIWIRADEYTGDLAAVTAIAIDMRYKADGETPFTVEGEKNIDVIINMHSPGTVPESEYAYNRPAFQASTWTENAPGNAVVNFEIGSRTVLALRDLQDVVFTKFYTVYDPETGEVMQNPLAAATFALYQCINPTGDYLNVGMPGTSAASSCWSTAAMCTTLSNASGTVSFTKLDSGIYAIRETAAAPTPAGIQRLGYRFWVFTVDAVAGTVSDIVGYSTNDNYPPVQMVQGANGLMLEDPFYTRDISVVKEWDDDNDIEGIRPDSVHVQLKRNDADYGPVVTLNADNEWSYTWTALPRYSAYTSSSDNTPYTYTVTEIEEGVITGVDDEGTYKYTITGSMANGFTITNKHTHPKGKLSISKAVTSGNAETGFTVLVTLHMNDNPVTGSFTAEITGGTESTATVTFNDEGEATFTIHNGETWLIKELPSEAVYTVSESGLTGGWSLQTSSEDLTGSIVADDVVSVTLTNTYDATGEATLTATKALAEGAEWPEGKTLTLTLCADEGTPMPETVTATLTEPGEASFGPIEYGLSDAGNTYTYTISEDGFGDGWTGSGDITVTVEVTDNGNGTLNTEVTYSPEDKTIINTYDATGEATLTATKALAEGAEWPEGKTLTLTLSAEEGTPMPETVTATLTEPGEASFGPIEYGLSDAGNTYTYTISEDGFGDGWTGSGDITVTVEVTDNGNGTLGTEVTYSPEDKTIINTYDATGEATLTATKALAEGAEWPEGKTLTLTLSAEEGTPMPETVTATLTEPGEATFGPIEYVLSDAGNTYTYTISEDGFGDGWEGSGDITVTVKVTDNGNGTLGTEVTYSPEDAVIINTYSASGSFVPKVTKVLEGRDLKEGEFTFTLTDSEGNVLETVTNDAAGKVVFSALEYTEADAGETYTYYIAETEGDEEGMTYDTHVETLTVKVENKKDGTLKVTGTYSGDQKFINDVTPPPQTGDMSNLGVWFLMMISSWAFALVLLTIRKQKRMKASKQ